MKLWRRLPSFKKQRQKNKKRKGKIGQTSHRSRSSLQGLDALKKGGMTTKWKWTYHLEKEERSSPGKVEEKDSEGSGGVRRS